MAGHSKWANIRHRKERQDQKKGKLWSKASKAIMAAARSGGPDPATNLKLRYAIEEAKYVNMPKDTIKRAIEKGSGAGDGDAFQEITYEGYGPGGTAVLIEALTDNNTRTVNDIRNIFKKVGCSLGTSGSVAYLFDTRGRIVVRAGGRGEDELMELALELGAEDVEMPDDDAADDALATIFTPIDTWHAVREAADAAGLEIAEAGIAKIPQNTVAVTGDDVRKIISMLDALDDNEDVQKVYSNADIAEDELAALG